LDPEEYRYRHKTCLPKISYMGLDQQNYHEKLKK
jgi:Tfp pilus assembly ATPase PilU